MGVTAGTYIPPGPMLNSASTRLACLEDVEIDVSPPGAPQHLFRRRVFAPEDNRDERYLTASDVVKVSSPCFLQALILTRSAVKGQCIVVEDELPWAALFPLSHTLIASSCYHLLGVLCAVGRS